MRTRTNQRHSANLIGQFLAVSRSNHTTHALTWTRTSRSTQFRRSRTEVRCSLFPLASNRPLEDSSQLLLFETCLIWKGIHLPIYWSRFDWIISRKSSRFRPFLVSRSSAEDEGDLAVNQYFRADFRHQWVEQDCIFISLLSRQIC